jgi:hypothetical protein
MSDRLEELAMRRRRLLLRSERLRADLAADQQVMLEALSGVDRAISTAKKAAKPVFLIGAGLLLFKLIRGRRRGGRAAAAGSALGGLAGVLGGGRAATAGSGLLMRALFWVSIAQRALPYVSLARNLWRSRSSRHGRSYADAGAETEHLL